MSVIHHYWYKKIKDNIFLMSYYIFTELPEHIHFSLLWLVNYFILTSIQLYRKHWEDDINDYLGQKIIRENFFLLELLRLFTLLPFPPPIIILPASGDHNIYLKQILLLYSCSTGPFWLCHTYRTSTNISAMKNDRN